jgi:glycyl-tRNA synthetase (class II)
MSVLVSERERCERLYYDNPKNWDERKYANRLKKQGQWIKSKATKVAEKLKKKEEKNQNQFNKDIDLFANLYFNQNYT